MGPLLLALAVSLLTSVPGWAQGPDLTGTVWLFPQEGMPDARLPLVFYAGKPGGEAVLALPNPDALSPQQMDAITRGEVSSLGPEMLRGEPIALVYRGTYDGQNLNLKRREGEGGITGRVNSSATRFIGEEYGTSPMGYQRTPFDVRRSGGARGPAQGTPPADPNRITLAPGPGSGATAAPEGGASGSGGSPLGPLAALLGGAGAAGAGWMLRGKDRSAWRPVGSVPRENIPEMPGAPESGSRDWATHCERLSKEVAFLEAEYERRCGVIREVQQGLLDAGELRGYTALLKWFEEELKAQDREQELWHIRMGILDVLAFPARLPGILSEVLTEMAAGVTKEIRSSIYESLDDENKKIVDSFKQSYDKLAKHSDDIIGSLGALKIVAAWKLGKKALDKADSLLKQLSAFATGQQNRLHSLARRRLVGTLGASNIRAGLATAKQAQVRGGQVMALGIAARLVSDWFEEEYRARQDLLTGLKFQHLNLRADRTNAGIDFLQLRVRHQVDAPLITRESMLELAEEIDFIKQSWCSQCASHGAPAYRAFSPSEVPGIRHDWISYEVGGEQDWKQYIQRPFMGPTPDLRLVE